MRLKLIPGKACRRPVRPRDQTRSPIIRSAARPAGESPRRPVSSYSITQCRQAARPPACIRRIERFHVSNRSALRAVCPCDPEKHPRGASRPSRPHCAAAQPLVSNVFVYQTDPRQGLPPARTSPRDQSWSPIIRYPPGLPDRPAGRRFNQEASLLRLDHTAGRPPACIDFASNLII